ncbi:MAG: NAD(+)/NADH kinase [Muribaculaceae bacterium]|nr:NAD(+)/NADH kinase [Muribaculaceae bacterium]
MLTIAVYGSRRQEPASLKLIDSLLRELSARGCRLLLHSKIYSSLTQGGFDPACWNLYAVTDSDRFSAKLVISIGGDGTFLRTARWVGDKEIPIVGVNSGHLGYLTAFDITNTPALLKMLFSGEFFVERRSVIRVAGEHLPPAVFNCALNEIAIMKHDSASMITIDAAIDGHHLSQYKADGLLVATPTGSTGYSLSVGGPIIQPTAPTFVISPIAAHSLTMRPLVITDNSILTLTVGGRSQSCFVSIDGNSFPVPTGATLTVSKAPYSIKVVMPDNHGFATTLREKLLWGI